MEKNNLARRWGKGRIGWGKVEGDRGGGWNGGWRDWGKWSGDGG